MGALIAGILSEITHYRMQKKNTQPQHVFFDGKYHFEEEEKTGMHVKYE